jgi:ribonuclease Z
MIELVFLGTSAATPTQRRNVSALVAQMETESILFDVGEGTQLQILRSGIRRGRINRVFISHLHGDHFYGLIGLLTSFQLNKRDEPLDLIGPVGLRSYIDFMKRLSQTNFSYDLRILECPDIQQIRPVFECDEYQVLAGPLRHRLPTLGYRVEERDRPGRFDAKLADELGVPFGPERGVLQAGKDLELADGSIVRSADVVGESRKGSSFATCSDTAYCATSVSLARDVDVLIHESTFDPSDRRNARRTLHSTTDDAIRVAKEAGVRQLILTHFSTRYMGNMEPILTAAEAGLAGTVCARDFLQIDVHSDRDIRYSDSRNRRRKSGKESEAPSGQSNPNTKDDAPPQRKSQP